MRFERRLYASKPPEETLRLIADFRNLKAWDDSVQSVVARGAVFGQGSKYDVRVLFSGNPIDIVYTVTVYEPGVCAVLTGVAPNAKVPAAPNAGAVAGRQRKRPSWQLLPARRRPGRWRDPMADAGPLSRRGREGACGREGSRLQRQRGRGLGGRDPRELRLPGCAAFLLRYFQNQRHQHRRLLLWQHLPQQDARHPQPGPAARGRAARRPGRGR